LTPQQLPKPGDVVGGKYRVERTVGHGGMSVVFEVSHRITDKRFAVKWMLPEDSGDGDMVKRFVREAKVAGRCQHPNIVEVYDIDQDGGAFFIVMELLEGESLARRLERVGRLSVGEACRLLIPCMEGLGVAHAAGIVHRDLKPANIFVCAARGREPERAMLLDFGVSQFTTLPGAISATHTKRGAVLGTPFYMPVEQLRGQRIDHRIDVYALGVTLFEALSGQRPFHAERYVDLVIKIAEQEPTRLETLVPGIPRGIVEIVSRAMAREAVDRYSTVAELIVALQPYQHGFDDVAMLSGTRAQPWLSQAAETPLASESIARQWAASASSTRRWRWLAVTVLGLLLVALAAVGARRRQSTEEREAQPPAASKPRADRTNAEREGAQGSAAQTPAEPVRGGAAPLPPSAAESPASAPSGSAPSGSAPPGSAPSAIVPSGSAPSGNASSVAVPSVAAPLPAAPSTPAPMPPPAASDLRPASPSAAAAASTSRSTGQGSARKPNQPAEPGRGANLASPPSKGSPKQAAAPGESPSPAPQADVTSSAHEGEPIRHVEGPTPVPLDRSEF
jgi:serine/threonine-protein kinase